MFLFKRTFRDGLYGTSPQITVQTWPGAGDSNFYTVIKRVTMNYEHKTVYTLHVFVCGLLAIHTAYTNHNYILCYHLSTDLITN